MGNIVKRRLLNYVTHSGFWKYYSLNSLFSWLIIGTQYLKLGAAVYLMRYFL